MNPLLLGVGSGFLSLIVGTGLGYILRMQIAKQSANSQEKILAEQKEAQEAALKKEKRDLEKELDQMTADARAEAAEIRQTANTLEKSVLKRETDLERREQEFEQKREELRSKAQKVKALHAEVETMKEKQSRILEERSGLTRDDAKRELMMELENESDADLMEATLRMERDRQDFLTDKAKMIMVTAMQRYAQDVTSDVTTSIVSIPSDEVKGKIIGKEGRNIRTLENITGVQVIVDDTPESIVVSSFDPIRRNIAKLAIEELIADGRIQPARIEEFVAKAKENINEKIREAGQAALYDTGITGIDPKLTYILGRLRYRTSYGQNVLMHSIEVAHIAGALAAELGANVQIAKMGGLFHDVGKALDHEVEGTHVEIGRQLLHKYRIKPEVVQAMQSHHEEYPYETIESRIVQAADAISASRPGARRDTVDNYIKRLGELENIANAFNGVERTYAINAGREIRVFVRPHAISDLHAKKMARNIAMRIEEDLQYPGEIKVTIIRETRVIDYAR